ncbi:MAG: DUF4956 domain-containing protein [Ruminococcus sp.]|nr:DUF4956 domain-containing protein [Ruminococcus sp.]
MDLNTILNTIYSSSVTAEQFFTMAGASLLFGILYAFVISFRIRSTRRFFTVTALIPFVVAAVITFVNGNIGAGVAIGGAFSLIRFRSAQGSADEIAAIFIAMSSGIAFGMGYIAYGIIILVCLSLLFIAFSALPIFEHKRFAEENLLRITIPESLEYQNAFDEVFKKYLTKCDNVGVKTTAMGSMFKLSYKIKMKDSARQKEFVDELRTQNGNLEIAIMPFVETENQL